MTALMFNTLQSAKAAELQLKNLRSCQARDGVAWSGSVYFQGKKVGAVYDQGCGGPVNCEVPNSVLQPIRDAVEAAGYQLLDWNGQPFEKPFDLNGFAEFFFADLADEVEAAKRMRPKLKTKTLVRMKGDPAGELQVYSVAFSPEVKARLCDRHGDKIEFFMNEKINDLL